MQRPSITFINRVYPPQKGATGRMLSDLAHAFMREGWKVTIITTGEKSKKENDKQIDIIRVKAPQKTRSIFAYIIILIKLTLAALKQPREHIIVSMTDPPLLAIAIDFICKRKKNRHIHWCHDIYPDLLPVMGYKISQKWFTKTKLMMTRALNRCDRIIVIGQCMGRFLSNNGQDPKLLTVIPNWADKNLIAPDQDNEKISRPPASHLKAYSKPHTEQIKQDRRFRVLYAGTLGLAHPIDTILNAAKTLQDKLNDVEFVFVGEGDGFDKLSEERAKMKLDNIRLMPPQPARNLRALMESGDLHLISMNQNAAGLLVPCKLYSALATGRPCVFLGPSASETAKTIQKFGAGSVVNQGHDKELSQVITQYVLDSDTWFTAQKGAINASKTLSPANAIEAWIKRAWTVIEPEIKGQ